MGRGSATTRVKRHVSAVVKALAKAEEILRGARRHEDDAVAIDATHDPASATDVWNNTWHINDVADMVQALLKDANVCLATLAVKESNEPNRNSNPEGKTPPDKAA